MISTLLENHIIKALANQEEIFWINNKIKSGKNAFDNTDLSLNDLNDAENRLKRFAPFIMKCFPETISSNGIIESPLSIIDSFAKKHELFGNVFLKRDSELAVAGSVKARGGIYEVLKHTEEIALKEGIISSYNDDYTKINSEYAKSIFNKYTIQVGSTGNLGMSIGISASAIGYNAIVHMSSDAKQWKKDLLRSHGVKVIEYEADYSEAVAQGRESSKNDSKSYFVDDENSKDLFLGYSVAAKRLKKQLDDFNVAVDREHPLFVFIPCGIGGAPGGITFGLKLIFGDNVHVFFAEPTNACCMLLGMESGYHNKICVKDIGLSGITDADGLAVGRASGFVGKIMDNLLSGIMTVNDNCLNQYTKELFQLEKFYIEPSSSAGIKALLTFNNEWEKYCSKHNISIEKLNNSTQILWATGGSLVPKDVRDKVLNIK